MHVGVNTRFLLPGKLEGFGVYTDEIVKRMAVENSSDSFTLYFDRKPDNAYTYAPNVDLKSVFPPARHPVLFYIWFQLSLKRKLLSDRPDVFFSPDSFMPLGMAIPSVITIHDTAYLRFPEYISKSHLHYYQKNMPKFVDQAAHIITVSEFSKKEICSFYNVESDRVTVIYNGVSARFKPIDGLEQQNMRDQYSDGKAYFLYVGAIHPRKNIARLIQAFDLFKKENEGDIQLIIAGRQSWQIDEVFRAHSQAEFKNDIRIIGYVPSEDLPLLVASAFALVYVSLYEGFGLPVLEAMACGVPVITSSNDSLGAVMAEVTDGAALVADPESVEAIAREMGSIYTQNSLYSRLQSEGIVRAKQFSWEDAATRTYEVLQGVI